MTIVQVVPETIIWEHVAFRLGQRQSSELSHRKYFPKLPEKIFLSSDFLDVWTRNVTVAIRKKIVDDFGLRTFLLTENDQTVRRSVLDTEFWKEVQLSFSPRAVDRIWEDTVGRVSGKKPSWRDVTPGDALFLCILDKKLYETYSFEWLVGNNAEWIVSALFLSTRTFENPANLPWAIYFHQYKRIPLPLREVLIERTAAFFKALAEGVLRFVDAASPPLQFGSELGAPPVRFSFGDGVQVLRAGLEDPFQTKPIRAAVAYWANEGTLGLDDGRYIESACTSTGLLRYMDAYHEEVTRFQEVAREGGMR